MTSDQTKYIIQILTKNSIVFDTGLSDKEILQIETKFDFKFPPDLKTFYQTALPVSDEFVNWRLGLQSKDDADKIIDRLNWPLEGMLFDIQANNYWSSKWGDRPESYEEKVIVAKRHYATYPKLIPIYSHRYIPSCPNENDNPIFSVYQMDIIYYGLNLEHYFANEFRYTRSGRYELDEYPKRKIEFWSDIAEDENIYN